MGQESAAHAATYNMWWRSHSDSGSIPSVATNTGLDLRAVVAVRNTVRRLERDMHAEIMAAFAAPVSMG